MSEPIQVEEALGRLAIVPDYDPGGGEGPGPCVHTFTGGPILLGAHHRVDAIRADFERAEQLEQCKGPAGHNVAAVVDGRLLYYETK